MFLFSIHRRFSTGIMWEVGNVSGARTYVDMDF